MFRVAPTLLDGPVFERHTNSAVPWLSYSVDNELIHRHVMFRNGVVSTSSLPRLASSGELAADFDLSWLCSPVPPSVLDSSESISVADLFAGCGGMSLGLKEAARALGLDCTFSFASELDPIKSKVYETNLAPSEVYVGAVETLVDGAVGSTTTLSERTLLRRLAPIDVLLGGPPCQGHSDLNNHTRRDDARNSLIDRMVRFAELLEPPLVIIENVEGIKHDRRGSAAKAGDHLRALGYHVVESTIIGTRLGVPQSRRRYVLVAARRDISVAVEEFEKFAVAERSVGWAIEDLLTLESNDTFDTAAVHSAVNQRRIRHLFDNDLYDLPDSERPDCHRLKPHSYRGVYGRMRWGEPAPTITTGFGSTGQGRFVHPKQARTLTPHEAARLQTYPDYFNFGSPGRTQLQKMIGNSVPPLAMAALGMALLR